MLAKFVIQIATHEINNMKEVVQRQYKVSNVMQSDGVRGTDL